MKRIIAVLMALCLLCALPGRAGAQSAPTLLWWEEAGGAALTLEGLEETVCALQLELVLQGACPDAAFVSAIPGAFAPECRVEVRGNETAVTVYITASEGVLTNADSLYLGTLEAGGGFYMPERGELILLNRDLQSCQGSGTVLLRSGQAPSGGGSGGGGGGIFRSSHTVTALPSDHGSLSVQPSEAFEGRTVAVTALPDEGYRLESLTAADVYGRSVPLRSAGRDQYTFAMPGQDVELTAVFVPEDGESGGTADTAGPLPFLDVPEGYWCRSEVEYVYRAGLMNGTSADTFSPAAATTRGMIVTILYRMEGSPAAGASAFSDVTPGAYYASAVAWAAANGIAAGYEDGSFRPENNITREQMAAFLFRYAQYQGRDVSARGDLSGYKDADRIGAYAVEPIRWANAAGLINGTSADTISPDGNATREQAAVILARFMRSGAPAQQ